MLFILVYYNALMLRWRKKFFAAGGRQCLLIVQDTIGKKALRIL